MRSGGVATANASGAGPGATLYHSALGSTHRPPPRHGHDGNEESMSTRPYVAAVARRLLVTTLVTTRMSAARRTPKPWLWSTLSGVHMERRATILKGWPCR
jgi:hypothetical protein